MVFVYVLSFVSGLLVKAVDFIEDDYSKRKTQDPKRKTQNWKLLSWPLAIAYGLTIGYLVSQTPFSMIFLAALFAQLLAGKIDTSAHGTGFTLAIIATVYFGIPQFDFSPFFVFLVFAVLDEIEFFKGTFDFMHHHRLFLPLAAAVFAIAGKYEYLLGIVPFDIGYLLSEYGLTNRFKQSLR